MEKIKKGKRRGRRGSKRRKKMKRRQRGSGHKRKVLGKGKGPLS